MRNHHLVNGFVKTMDRFDEPLPGETLVELYGGRRVLIEHHLGVTEYSRDKIKIRVRYGHLCVCGSCLEISKMTSNQLVISGKIDGVMLFRRD